MTSFPIRECLPDASEPFGHEADDYDDCHAIDQQVGFPHEPQRLGKGDIDALLPVVYADVPPRLHAVAARSLRAHLLKLRADGRVSESDGTWSLRTRSS